MVRLIQILFLFLVIQVNSFAFDVYKTDENSIIYNEKGQISEITFIKDKEETKPIEFAENAKIIIMGDDNEPPALAVKCVYLNAAHTQRACCDENGRGWVGTYTSSRGWDMVPSLNVSCSKANDPTI